MGHIAWTAVLVARKINASNVEPLRTQGKTLPLIHLMNTDSLTTSLPLLSLFPRKQVTFVPPWLLEFLNSEQNSNFVEKGGPDGTFNQHPSPATIVVPGRKTAPDWKRSCC